MMKALVTGIVLAASTYAGANCTARLESRSGAVIDTYRAYSCRDAKRECNRDLARRSRRGTDRGLRCVTNGDYNPYPTPSLDYCTVNMRRNNGNIIDSFTGEAYSQRQACNEAQRECERDLERRQRNGRNPRAYCDGNGRDNGNPDYGQRVTRTCTVERYNYRTGRFVDYHTATVTGRRGTGVEAKACQEALQDCNYSSGFYQSCRQL